MKSNINKPAVSDIKIIVIMRGVSGSGKTTIAEALDNLLYTVFEKMGFEDFYDLNTYKVCSNDHYFTNSRGEYNFDAMKLPEAFDHCKKEFDDAIGEGANIIIIDNTNMIPKHYDYYVSEGKFYDYKVVQLCTHTESISREVAETFFERNVHNVPIHSLVNQLRQYHKDCNLERYGVQDVVSFFREKLSAIKSHNASFERAIRHQSSILRKIEEEVEELAV